MAEHLDLVAHPGFRSAKLARVIPKEKQILRSNRAPTKQHDDGDDVVVVVDELMLLT